MAIGAVFDDCIKIFVIKPGMITLSVFGTMDVQQACDARADMGMTCSVIVQCADCVVFSRTILH